MSVPDLRTEYRTLDLGDSRRNIRAIQIIGMMQARPAASLPSLFADPSQLEGAYRLTNNEHVNYGDLLAPHARETWGRASAGGLTLILHDTTGFEFPGEVLRDGLAEVGTRQGFFGHFAVAVPEGRSPVVHGVVAMHPYVIKDHGWWWTPDGKQFDELIVGSQRWSWAVKQLRKAAPPDLRCIHVMDREGDDYVLFSQIADLGDDFVIRSLHDRTDENRVSLTQAASAADFLLCREVFVGRRSSHGRKPKAIEIHPDRESRTAKLSCRGATLQIKQPRHAVPIGKPTMSINVVEVVEIMPPDGTVPVYWRLITTLPVGTLEEVARVVDIYRKRWLIEVFFKALKTGTDYEKRQATSLKSLLNMLALSIPNAWRILSLRALSRDDPTLPATEVVDALELHVLRQHVPAKMVPTEPTIRQVLLAVARLGGHLPSNGDPGWQTIGRGWEKLMTEVDGWRAALAWAQKDFK